MTIEELKRAYPPLTDNGRARIMSVVRGFKEEEPVKKKMTLSLALALALALAAVGALAAGLYYSIKDSTPEALKDKVVTIDSVHEGDGYVLRVNDAVFDGMRMSVALQAEEKDGGERLVFPEITASADGKELNVDVDDGFEYFSGFWIPGRGPQAEEQGKMILGMALLKETETGANGAVTADKVEWKLRAHVLKPNWEIKVDENTLEGAVVPGKEPDFEKLCREAFADKKILLFYGSALTEYAAYLQAPEGVAGEEWDEMPAWRRLVASGAFSEQEVLETTFVTEPASVEKMAAVAVVKGKDYEIRVEEMNLTLAGGNLHAFVKRDKNSAPIYLEARVNGQVLPYEGTSLDDLSDNGVQEMWHAFIYEGKAPLPDKVTLVPFTEKEGGESFDDLSARLYDEAAAVEVSLK